ncbi:MAG: FAD-dependent oxidoreductase, partial [Chloroflexi bacterium]|nr:FAD-dependent oxidoreductase [Chloroflexota bacterium]
MIFGNLLEPTARARRVLVLGAGLAGLAAGYELMRAGHDVTLLEARMLPGGRVRTLRAPFADGLYAEAGAARIPDDHAWTMGYIRHFGLALTPFRPQPSRDVRYLRGRRFEATQADDFDYARLPLALSELERRIGLREEWRRIMGPVLDEVGDPAAPGWPGQALLRYDRLADAQLLLERGLSPDAVAWEMLGDCDPSDGEWALSALDALRLWALRERETARYKIVGGNDLLPAAFAQRLSARIVYGAEVRRIEQNATEVRVGYRRAGLDELLSADHAICALPLPILRGLQVSPPLPAILQRAM